jgi:exodeoxyribonuclease VIII
VKKEIIGLGEAEYGKLPGLRSGHLKALLRSHAHYEQAVKDYHPGHSTERRRNPLRLGELTHLHLFEPERVAAECTVLKEFGRKKEDQKAKEEWMLEVQDKRIFAPQDEFTDAEEMAASVWRHPRCAKLLESGQAETTLQWDKGLDGLSGKARLDWKMGSMPVIVDLKTTGKSADPESFGKTVLNYHYHMSAAWYLRGAHAVYGENFRFVLIAVESTPPYSCQPYALSDEWLELGDALIERALENYNHAQDAPLTTFYSESLINPILPGWAKMR